MVEALRPQPAVMDTDPGVPAGVDDALPQQHLRQPVPGPHQVTTDVLTGTRSRAASCPALGTVTSGISPIFNSRAKSSASRASAFTRSPDGRCNFDGAATTHRRRHERSDADTSRSRSAEPHTPPSPAPATPKPTSKSRPDQVPGSAATPHQSTRPRHTPSPTRRAQPTRQTYDSDSLRPYRLVR